MRNLRRIGSKIASIIDKEYQLREQFKKQKDFKKTYCDSCKNRDTYRCDIRMTIDNEYKCTEYEEE